MKKTILFIALVIVIALGSFFGGMKYGQNKNSGARFQAKDMQNLTVEQRQQMASGNFQGMRRIGDSALNGSGFLNGEILSKDDQSITLKLIDGGSKIIFFSASTQVLKTATGTIENLKVGDTIMANGATNSDGSLTAQTLQVRSPEIKP